jgi:hypothetical protein
VVSLAHASSSKQLSVAIGQVPLVLYFSADELLQKASCRYASFQAPGSGALPVFVRTDRRLPPDATDFLYTLSDSTVCLGSGAAQFFGVRHEYALDSLLRILLSVLLLPRHGFLLHAATVVRGKRAFVFTGRSGVGKSTVAALSAPSRVLTDEISLLRLSEGAWHAYGTPFWGEFRAAGMNRHVPVAGIYTLTQSTENRLERLSVTGALRALLPNVLFFASGKPQTEALLELLALAVGMVPVYRLHFLRHPSFWEVIAP